LACRRKIATSIARSRGAIVNNESSEIIRMMNCAFNALGAKSGDYYPEELRLEIESVNTRV
jgi:glutathionyl-hydroquinone reductase